MGLRVGMTYNIKDEFPLKPGDPPDLNAEFDHEETVSAIEHALRLGGHDVIRIGNARNLIERIPKLDVDIVFNIAEGYEGRNRESQVPILLEMLRIPFVGADGLTQGLALDKVLTKKMLIAEGIPTPRFVELDDNEQLPSTDLRFPLIVKLRHEGSSKGMRKRSLVSTQKELSEQIRWLRSTYSRPSIFLEEFIEGREFTVAITGNDMPKSYPVCQIMLDGDLDLGRRFYTFAYLRHGADYLCPAQIDAVLSNELQALAQRTYRMVECRDFGRVDFRVDSRGKPYVLEINPLPSLSLEDVFCRVARSEGISYDSMINCILDAAVSRYGLDSRINSAGRNLSYR